MLLAVLVGLISVWGTAVADTVAPKRNAPANTPIEGFYVPRWGAYRRRKAAEDLREWEHDFSRAQVELRRAGGPQGSSAATHG